MAAQDKAAPGPGRTGKLAAKREPSLGNFLIEARKQRGLSADNVVRQTKVPAHYVHMIENDDYGLIADQLYLLPFLRRYATFIGLDSEEIATRFIREVQRTEGSVSRMSEPIPVIERTVRRTWSVVVLSVAATLVIVAAAYVALERHRHRLAAASEPTASTSASMGVTAGPGAPPESSAGIASPAAISSPAAVAVPAESEGTNPPGASAPPAANDPGNDQN